MERKGNIINDNHSYSLRKVLYIICNTIANNLSMNKVTWKTSIQVFHIASPLFERHLHHNPKACLLKHKSHFTSGVHAHVSEHKMIMCSCNSKRQRY